VTGTPHPGDSAAVTADDVAASHVADYGEASRIYVSPLRQAQTERTRELILEALAAQLAQPGLTEFSVPDVARQAGVSVRTVYHHFPNREAQMEALAKWIDQRLAGAIPAPTTAAELPALAIDLYHAFGANEALGRAQASPGLARRERRERRQQRLAAIEAVVHNAAADPTDDRARWAAALIKHLIGADAAIFLLDEMGLSIDDAGHAVAWATQLLLTALADPPPP
jgi:AcrR family transcriptional regulator